MNLWVNICPLKEDEWDANCIFQELVLRLKARILSAFQLYNSVTLEQNKPYV